MRPRTEAAALLRRYDQIAARRTAKYRDDPVAWVHDHIVFDDGEGPVDYQNELLAALVQHGRVAARIPRGGGKTAPAAWATLHYALTRQDDWKVPTTAGSWLQLSKFLWPEIHKWARRLRWDRIGRDPFSLRTELLTLRLSLPGGEAFAINSDQPDLLEGAHARSMLAIVDEGKAVPDASWDAIEGYFSDPGEKRALALSIPGAPAGRFYDIHARHPGYEDWWPIHVTIDQAVRAGRVRPEWVEQRKAQWGEDSALYLNHVLAEFGGEPDGVIPLAWVEAAVDRWRTRDTMPTPEMIGVDVADEGADDTVLALRSGDIITELRRYGQGDTMLTAERVALHGVEAIVDSIGVGAGVLARLRQLLGNSKAVGFVASERTERMDRTGEFGFTNKRSAAWWNLRELLEPPSNLCLPDDPLLLGDLTAPRWREVAGGRIGIESKDDIRKRLGRSTDAGDACLVGTTPVLTARGTIPLEAVARGDLVWTRRGWCDVLVAAKTGEDRPVLTVEFDNGSSLTGTAEHPVLTSRGWAPLSSLRCGGTVVVWKPSNSRGSSSSDTLGPITAPRGSTTTPRPVVVPKRLGHSTRKSGRLTTDQSPTDGTFITSTATLSTTTCPISKFSTRQSTSIVTRLPGTIRKQTVSTSSGSGRRRLSGIEATRDGPGIGNTVAAPGRTRLPYPAFATNVAPPTTRGAPTPGSVPSTASSAGAIDTSSDGSQSSANGVGNRSWPPQPTGGFVATHVRRITANGTADVYNLEVADQAEFVAADAVVHNCVMVFWDEGPTPVEGWLAL